MNWRLIYDPGLVNVDRQGLKTTKDLALKPFYLFSKDGQLLFTAPALFDSNQRLGSPSSDTAVYSADQGPFPYSETHVPLKPDPLSQSPRCRDQQDKTKQPLRTFLKVLKKLRIGSRETCGEVLERTNFLLGPLNWDMSHPLWPCPPVVAPI